MSREFLPREGASGMLEQLGIFSIMVDIKGERGLLVYKKGSVFIRREITDEKQTYLR